MPAYTLEKTIFIGSDHRGFKLKESLKNFLVQSNYKVTDLGPKTLDPEDDFNIAAQNVARAVQMRPDSYGILICGSAHGIAMQANRFKKVRAIAAYTPELAKIGREHNDANVLCLSADFVEPLMNEKIAQAFLETKFLEEERFVRRNLLLDKEVE